MGVIYLNLCENGKHFTVAKALKLANRISTDSLDDLDWASFTPHF